MGRRSVAEGFLKIHKSSGFHPFLIFFFLLSCLLSTSFFFHAPIWIQAILIALTFVCTIGFLYLFFEKARRDPDFCRSESHVQKMTELGIGEKMGSNTAKIDIEKLISLPRNKNTNGNGKTSNRSAGD